MSTLTFPEHFRWGAASAAYQIEGAVDADGRGKSVWDAFGREPGRIWSGHRGDHAADHYHHVAEDLALMRELGLKAYRFSFAWPRILPAGTGKVNEAGLAFYDTLVDGLLAAGIEPWVTLYHWDYPYELYCRGGWLNPESPRWFADYARVVVDRFSDRVTHWLTHNEPQCFIGLGLHNGEHAPGLKLPFAEVLRAAHHALLGHGLAVQVIRERSKRPAKVGWAHTGTIPYPASGSAEDLEAARQAWAETKPNTVWNHTWWNDPVFLGRYPEDGLRTYGQLAPRFTAEEMRTIAQPVDFYGTNNYTAYPVRSAPAAERVPMPPGSPISHMDWPVSDELLYWAARWPFERYGKPVVFTENGFSGLDWIDLDGRVPDGGRIDYMRRQLRSLRRALNEGFEVLGYFHWALLDDFEWQFGYRYRFGLVHVDFATFKRTPKDSFHWYRDMIASRGRNL